MFYSQRELFNRIKTVLPSQWFGQNTPVLDSVLNSLAAGWAGLFDLLSYTVQQTRIHSASGGWLDLISQDYFGRRLLRRQRETDGSFGIRIRQALLRDRCTRASIYNILLDLTHISPIIFEPSNPQDTGCYGAMASSAPAIAGYGTSGGWGSLNLPFQAFIRVFRAEIAGVAMVNGWGGGAGGYRGGFESYISLEMVSPQADDSELYLSVSQTAPAGTINWISIES